MKKSLIALAASAAVLAFAVQTQLPPVLQGHATKLKDAQTLKAKLQVDEVGGSRTIVEITYSRPNFFKVDGPTQLVLGDGANVTVLEKGKNSYSQTAYGTDATTKSTGTALVWAWASFYQLDTTKLFKAAKPSPATKLRGVEVTPVEVTAADGKSTATVYIETKTGVARGFQTKADGKDYIVWAETIEVGTAAMPPTAFSFVAPAGSTKVDPNAAPEANWATVSTIFTQNCMPCHSAQIRSGTLDLSSYAAATSSRFIVKGDAKTSALALSLRAVGGKRMPQGRPPLPEAKIKSIESWINDGLKQ
jgi:outer membrane lipoprotein-sorting protein